MKTKILYILILAVIYSLQINFAQEQQSTGAVPYMKVEKAHRIVNTLDNPASIAYAHNSQGGATLSMPIPAGTPWTTIGNFTPPGGSFATSMTQGGNGNFYLTTNAPQLYQFNAATGNVTLLGAITGASETPNGISYNLANSTYYLVGNTNFYSFNINTKVATLIGNMGVAGSSMIDLCFSLTGVCYAYDVVTDAAYTINISTGAATLLGPLGYDANFGQGMSYDYETQTIYLSAFNNSTFTGQLRTMNPQTGMTTLITDWGLNQLAPFAVSAYQPPPCPVGNPSNPNPPNGALNIPINGNTVTWTNGAGTLDVELWFGPTGNVVKVYDGPAITSFALPTLSYNTLYTWYVICKNEICGTQGSIWSFRTQQDPNLIDYCDEFENLSNWTIVGPLGTTNWSASSTSNAGGTPPELEFRWTPSFVGESKIRSDVISLLNNWCCELTFNFFFDWYADPSGTITVGITYDGGATSTIIYSVKNPTGNVGPLVVDEWFATPANAQNAQIEITFSGNSFNNDNIYWDNVCYSYPLSGCSAPNAPSNLIAQVIPILNPQVQLNWQDNSWNENGFKILRKKGYPNDPGEFIAIDTVLSNITQYLDTSVIKDSTYSYSVFAFNQWGHNGSDTVTITVSLPVGLEIISDELPNEFALHQNYPNPFNPTTKIKYTIPASSLNPFSKGEGTFVTLKVYDILGNEVAELVNEEQAPGVYEVEFSTSSGIRNLVSGIYFYQLSAGEFNQTKKMILLR
ncbi:MAG TPA: T9SS type A sorting domain-containing protein [Ignavibacteriaceae bacterium]|nr:T9SS type A sorting domain-containing protein [Ignavibacteriaceae bacterium]